MIWRLLRKFSNSSAIGVKAAWFLVKEHRFTKNFVESVITKPRQPVWVLYILTLVNFLAIMLAGWEKFFTVFDNSMRILIACETAAFAVVLFLVYKDKKRGNMTAMNWASFVVLFVVALGLYANHSGLREWLKDKDATEKAALGTTVKSTEVNEIKKEFNISSGECIQYVFRFNGGDFSSRPEGRVLVKKTTADGTEYRHFDGPDVLITMPKVEPVKIEYCSVGEPVKVVLREWRV